MLSRYCRVVSDMGTQSNIELFLVNKIDFSLRQPDDDKLNSNMHLQLPSFVLTTTFAKSILGPF